MSETAFSIFSVGTLGATSACFIGAALMRFRISLLLLGVHRLSIAGVLSHTSVLPEQAKQHDAEYRSNRALAFVPGSPLDPRLRRLYQGERWLRRSAWAGGLLLIASTLFSP